MRNFIGYGSSLYRFLRICSIKNIEHVVNHRDLPNSNRKQPVLIANFSQSRAILTS